LNKIFEQLRAISGVGCLRLFYVGVSLQEILASVIYYEISIVFAAFVVPVA
jgi:hypothetical protein